MLIGDPRVFAIESEITTAWESVRWRGVGIFLLHVAGHAYGLRGDDAASLGDHLINIRSRVDRRGAHVAPFAEEAGAEEIVFAFRHSTYADNVRETYLGMPTGELFKLLRTSDLLGLTCGMEAFDDGSEIIQLDIGDAVRLIAYNSTKGLAHDPASLRETKLAADIFYGTLERWADAFEAEWAATAKSPVPSHSSSD